ncbi:GTPase Era [Thiohalobacter thiocyanaticus]|uniref:GTPase Era n=1 Tax=Thiohalobacter thiocyanaticus TaxID=585455 RepID=A0A426QHH8_9GAMM|nr:GTPase Era [Thiohalobacter thiocyanaticus]RRQ21190.1 GTPase Era [Thiohalobacter thiocyanaticus]
MNTTNDSAFRCGLVALVGRPNVGKSTLLNRILGQKISITSSKPQTTRHRILGIKTTAQAQVVYVDTPGLHRGGKRALNRALNRAASDAIADVDLAVLVVEAGHWTDEDDLVLQRLGQAGLPVLLAVNKIDRLTDRAQLLPELQALAARFDFAEVLPLSATRGENLDRLEQCVTARLPEGPPYFPEEQITDRSERFLAAELIREKLFRRLGQELPYGLTVQIEQFKDDDGLLRIHGLVWVERDSQKAIVIGKGGAMLKQIGREARLDMERLFGAKVFLQLWVKVKSGWADDERALRSLGIDE